MRKKVKSLILLFCIFIKSSYSQQTIPDFPLVTSLQNINIPRAIRPINVNPPGNIHLFLEQSEHSRKVEQYVGLSMMLTGFAAVSTGLLLIDAGKKEELSYSHDPKVMSPISKKTISGQFCILGGGVIIVPGFLIVVFNKKKSAN